MYLWDRHGVSFLSNTQVLQRLILCVPCRICVITMLRIEAVIDFSKHHTDFPFTIFFDSLWSTLENSLGIINCTLPLMPPVIQKVGDSRVWQSLSNQTSRLNLRGYRSQSGNGSKHSQDIRHFSRDIESNFKPPSTSTKKLRSHNQDTYPLTSRSGGSMSGSVFDTEHPFPELAHNV